MSAHLGADVAAYVDGQLSPSAMRAAFEHLDDCDACDKAVRQQRLLKSRMSTVTTPEPPAELLASLAGLAARPPRAPDVVGARTSLGPVPCRHRRRRRLDRGDGRRVRGGWRRRQLRRRQDRAAVRPLCRRLLRRDSPTQAGATISDAKLDDLDHDGWPCKATLAGDLDRTSGSWADDAVALSYSNGTAKLNLFEQTGVLDHASLDGFEPSRLGQVGRLGP